MPLYYRSFTPGHLEFITTSTYQRTPLFRSEPLGREFVAVRANWHREMGLALMGWVLMPEDFHMLLRPEPAKSTWLMVKLLQQRTAFRILTALRGDAQNSGKHLARLRLPPTVHDDPSRFVEDFRKTYGLTPSRHRRLAPIGGCQVAMDGRRRTTG